MDNFNVIINKQTIVITTDSTTKWICQVNGNFSLSKYAGIGSTTITIIIPPSVSLADGYVEFVVNSYHCSSKLTYNINSVNDDYLIVSPTNINFIQKGDSMNINVSSTKPWSVTSNSNITITDIGTNGFKIISNADVDYSISITVTNGSQIKTITIHQKIKQIEDTCILIITKTPNNEDATSFQITVVSKKGNNFSPYVILSKPDNITLIDDGLGNIRGNINDVTKNSKGNISITNQCGGVKNTTINYNGVKVNDEVFYIKYNNNEYTYVSILYGKEPFNWNGNNIKLPYNENYSFDIISKDKNNNNVKWFVKDYNEEIIEVSSSQDKLLLRLIDYTKNDVQQSIVLENNLGKNINLVFTIASGLIDVSEIIFGIGLTDGLKNKMVTTNYDNNGVIVYIDSYKTLTVDSNIRWLCNNSDEVVKYTVTPIDGNGGHNNKVTITANDDILSRLEDDFIGTVTFQQFETYDYVTINITHSAIAKTWRVKETTTTSMTLSPSIVTVPPCANQQSEDITIIGFIKIIEELVGADGKIYNERTKYEEKDITDVVTWDNPSTDLTIKRNGTVLNVHSNTSNPYGSNDIVVNFKLSSDGVIGELKATQGTATQGNSEYKDMSAVINDVSLSIIPTEIERSGGTTTEIIKRANVTVKSYLTDSCGNINYGSERVKEEIYITEVIVKQINKDTVSGFTINNDYTTITVEENPWIYTFEKVDETITTITFPEKDPIAQKFDIRTKKETFNKVANFISEYTFNASYTTITKQSSVISLTQKGEMKIQEYELISKPTWVIVNMGDGSLTFNVEENEVTEVRQGEVIFRQKDSNKEIKYNITQEAGIFIPDFEFLVFRYYWSDTDGLDLDTATVVVNSNIEENTDTTTSFYLDNKAVGYGDAHGDGDPSPCNRVFGLSNNTYLEFGGDNTNSGNECVVIYYDEITKPENYGYLPRIIETNIYGNWFASRKIGDISIEVTAYKGGKMIKDPGNIHNFINEGGEVTFSSTENTNVKTSGSGKASQYATSYSYIAKVSYDKETKSAVLLLI